MPDTSGGPSRDPSEPDPNDAPSKEDQPLRDRVEEKYDFDEFTPADMAEMTVEEWEAVFDPNTWITGAELLDRVEADLKHQVANRELFAVIERSDDRVLTYTDKSYAIIHSDGSVQGEGPLSGDIEPTVALCSMADYDVPEPPTGELLPHPDTVPEGSGDLGNRLLQGLAAVLVVAGIVLLVVPVVFTFGAGGSGLLTGVVGLGFIVTGIVLLILVANARLSDRFRAEEYRERLRAAGVGSDDRPAFLPTNDEENR